ncbi:hypothetical protein TSUD_100220 [Trifolium subterraneum]|uniref:Uncharacterized protein n=1 Tax=Trifolium subterraneum TaxID=3900 RepID=A0A2Z6P6W6_TRISU|nr:hypothetical protein TSUD_100220 [Trifolium subterraneum]
MAVMVINVRQWVDELWEWRLRWRRVLFLWEPDLVIQFRVELEDVVGNVDEDDRNWSLHPVQYNLTLFCFKGSFWHFSGGDGASVFALIIDTCNEEWSKALDGNILELPNQRNATL